MYYAYYNSYLEVIEVPNRISIIQYYTRELTKQREYYNNKLIMQIKIE